MALTRRALLRGVASAAVCGLAGCGAGAPADTTDALWIWPGGLSDGVVQEARQRYAAKAALLPNIVQGDYLAQLSAVLTDGSGVPLIAGIKGEDVAGLLPRADAFVDLNTLGARDLASRYLPWKLQQGSTADGRLIGLPIDIGPTAMFYRSDLLAAAGLPAAPEAAGDALATWEDYLDAGERFREQVSGVHWLRNAAELFATAIGQATQRFVDESNHFVGDKDHVRRAWELSVALVERGLSANIPPGAEEQWAAAAAGGRLATELGAAWHAADIREAAPDTSGQWRVTGGPAAGANSGGSFLAVPAAGRDHALAFEIIGWLLSPENQERGFSDAALFPATPATYAMPALLRPDAFFGGQVTVRVFAASATEIRRVYEAPADAAIAKIFLTELAAVDAGRKRGDDAWASAVTLSRELATDQGVN